MELRYITKWNELDSETEGVYKKIQNQCDAFECAGMHVKKIICPYIKKPLRCIPFMSASLNWNAVNIDKTIEGVYIRYILADYQFISMLRRLRRQSPDVKIIVEFPTYPYDQENSLKQLPVILKDRFYRKQLHRFVDKAVTFGFDQEIFGIPTICTKNGINVSKISAREGRLKKGQIHLIAVAMFADWHGYDRLLKGLGLYYQLNKKRKVYFHLVGKSKEIEKYQQIVKQYQLQEYVIFHGVKSGKELDKVYEQVDIGIEVLGGHRKNVMLSSSLKSREYWAKGLPIISECEFPREVEMIQQYIMKVPADESPINIEKIIAFYDQIYIKSGKTQEEIIGEIRNFAYRTCDMSVTMKPIIDYIKSSAKEQGVAE